MKWDDQVYNTGSLQELDISKDIFLYINNLRPEYYKDDVVRLNVTSRLTNPPKTFSNQLTRYTASEYLPQNSMYAIQDAESEEYVIPFDSYNKISVDGVEGYFDLDMGVFLKKDIFVFCLKYLKMGIQKYLKTGVFKISR